MPYGATTAWAGRAGAVGDVLLVLERIYVDFNTMMMDGEGRVSIHPPAVRRSFRPGAQVVLSDEELEVDAELDGESRDGRWMALQFRRL